MDYLLPDPDLPYIVLDKRTFEMVGMAEKAAEDEVAMLLPAAVAGQDPNPAPFLKGFPPTVVQPSQHRLPVSPRLQAVYTRVQLAGAQVPPSEWGQALAHSYAEHGNWFVMAVLDASQLAGTGQFAGTNHFSPWSYDRHVPLAFYGAPFQSGEYHEPVAPVGQAVTLASLVGVNRPLAAVGRVLTEALKPIRQASGQ